MRIYNTLTGSVDEFRTREAGTAVIYVCGITPYDYSHLGHARTYVAFDIIRRWWEHTGLNVVHIQNVTDVEDKIIRRAREQKMPPLELAAKFDRASREDMAELGMLQPTHMPKISEFIPQTIGLIEKIIANGHAYVTESGVYFDISSFPDYGKLSGQDMEKIRSGARIEVDEKKKNPEDFALWKLDGTPGATYESPWGMGRPGWHIECSAMSLYYTKGQPLDAHGGARDLIFPHHENEIAQSEAGGTVPFCAHWMHTGFLTVNGEKMAKSLGNFITLRDALKKWDGQAIRMFFAMTHYRSPVDFSESAIDSAKNTLDNVRRSLTLSQGEGAEDGEGDTKEGNDLSESVTRALLKFEECMNNDFDTPNAIAALIGASKEAARAKAGGRVSRKILAIESSRAVNAFSVLGLHALAPAQIGSMPKDEIERLVAERLEARKGKDWKKSDEIRNLLKGRGVIVEDSKDGRQVWRYA